MHAGQDAADPAAALAALEADTAARRADGFDVEMLTSAQIDAALGVPSGRPGQYLGAQRFNYSATFHPGKYLFGLARGVGRQPTGAWQYIRPCAQQYVGKYQSYMITSD